MSSTTTAPGLGPPADSDVLRTGSKPAARTAASTAGTRSTWRGASTSRALPAPALAPSLAALLVLLGMLGTLLGMMATLRGTGLALGSSTAYERGLPLNAQLGSMGLPVLGDSPQIEIDLVASTAPPFDPGELGAAVAAPAIANALFSATRLRLRRLPLLSGGL